MPRAVAGPEIERLIQLLARLPGLGPRSARRAALHLVKRREELMQPLAAAIADANAKIKICSVCGNVDTRDPCTVCVDPMRDPSILVVVENVADLWALERAVAIACRYHVLGGTLSPLDGIGPDDLKMKELLMRLEGPVAMREVIIATNATVEGEATALYLARLLKPLGVKTTRLARGLPAGGDLEYSDAATLSSALNNRREL